jgi:hypothetical protein
LQESRRSNHVIDHKTLRIENSIIDMRIRRTMNDIVWARFRTPFCQCAYGEIANQEMDLSKNIRNVLPFPLHVKMVRNRDIPSLVYKVTSHIAIDKSSSPSNEY